MRPRISIVIPTIEEQAVFSVIKRLRELIDNPEIIIVDKSGNEYYRKLKDTGCRVIRQKDKGVESAIMQGLRAARGDILASIDADGTHDPDGIVKGMQIVDEGKADLVLGNRFGKQAKGAMPSYIRLGNEALSKIYSRAYKNRVHDVLTGLFVMNRKAFESIKDVEPYRAGIAFFAIELANRGYKIAEVPISYGKREHGTSKLAKSKLLYGLGVSGHMIRYARDYSPLLIFGSIGAVLIIGGIVLGILVLLSFMSAGVLTEPGRAMIAFMLVTIGFLSIIAGLIIDLLLQISRKLEKM